MEVPRYRKLTASTVLNLKPKEASLGDHKTITVAVVLSLTGTDTDLSNPNNHISRKSHFSLPKPPSLWTDKCCQFLVCVCLQNSLLIAIALSCKDQVTAPLRAALLLSPLSQYFRDCWLLLFLFFPPILPPLVIPSVP